MAHTFDNILLLGRPASGKSELIHFLKQCDQAERSTKYHIGAFDEIDDFPWLWEKFVEDNYWEAAGYPRRYSIPGENMGLAAHGAELFDYCMAKFNLEYAKQFAAQENYFADKTLFIEFARGGKTSYRDALQQLSPEILQNAAILFVDVSYEESSRRNEARYQEKLKHSILAHKCHEETMEIYYKDHDWAELTAGAESGHVTANDVRIPFVTVNNQVEPDSPAAYDARYGAPLRTLKELYDATV